jgi:hypothetical protein
MVVFSFYGMRAKYISKWYIVMVEDNQGGGAMDLGATPVEWWISCHDAQDVDRMHERPYHITFYMHVMFIILCILFCLDLIALVAL